MAINQTDQPKDPLLRLVLPALKRAARRAREEALRHNTDLIIWQDDRLCRISPRQIREESESYLINPKN